MEISGKIPPVKIGEYVKNVSEVKKTGSSPENDLKSVAAGDKVDLSKAAMEVEKARAQLDSVPDIREEEVAEIKDQIENGTYKVDGEKIAFNMVRESLIDEIV